MLDLNSLKEQLLQLGHSLPDDQILGILKDMNIEVSGTPGGVFGGALCTKKEHSARRSVFDLRAKIMNCPC
jgi:hypothetical protein